MEDYIHRLSIYQKPDLDNVKEVTSAEYYYDPRCHLSTHSQLINDYETMEAFRGWIEDNAHLIKVSEIIMSCLSDPQMTDQELFIITCR